MWTTKEEEAEEDPLPQSVIYRNQRGRRDQGQGQRTRAPPRRPLQRAGARHGPLDPRGQVGGPVRRRRPAGQFTEPSIPSSMYCTVYGGAAPFDRTLEQSPPQVATKGSANRALGLLHNTLVLFQIGYGSVSLLLQGPRST